MSLTILEKSIYGRLMVLEAFAKIVCVNSYLYCMGEDWCCVLPSFAIILLWKREMAALL